MRRPRWPLMTKAEHEAEVKRLTDLMQAAVDREYDRATKDGMARVHDWATAAISQFFMIDSHRAKPAAIAAFQHAERTFSPEPKTLSDHLYATTIEEDIHAASGS